MYLSAMEDGKKLSQTDNVSRLKQKNNKKHQKKLSIKIKDSSEIVSKTFSMILIKLMR